MKANWLKRILGAVVALAVPYVTTRYGEWAGTAVTVAGGALLHQADKFRKKGTRATDDPAEKLLEKTP